MSNDLNSRNINVTIGSIINKNDYEFVLNKIHPLDEVERLYRESFQKYFGEASDGNDFKIKSLVSYKNTENGLKQLLTDKSWINSNILKNEADFDIIRNDIHTCIEYDPEYEHFQMLDKDDYYNQLTLPLDETNPDLQKQAPLPGTCLDLSNTDDKTKFYNKGQFDHDIFQNANRFYELVNMGNMEKVFENVVDEFEAIRNAQHNVLYFQPMASTIFRLFAKLSNMRLSYIFYGNQDEIFDKQTAVLALDILYNMCSLASDAQYLKTSDALRSFVDEEGKTRGFGNPYEHKWVGDAWGVDTQTYLNDHHRNLITPGQFLVNLGFQLFKLKNIGIDPDGNNSVYNWEKWEYKNNPFIKLNNNAKLLDNTEVDNVEWMDYDASYPSESEVKADQAKVKNEEKTKPFYNLSDGNISVEDQTRYQYPSPTGIYSTGNYGNLPDDWNSLINYGSQEALNNKEKSEISARFVDQIDKTNTPHYQVLADRTERLFIKVPNANHYNSFWIPWFARSTSDQDNFNGDLTHIEMRWNRGLNESKIEIHWLKENKNATDEEKATMLDKAAFALAKAVKYCVSRNVFKIGNREALSVFNDDGTVNNTILLGDAAIALIIENLFREIYGFLGVKFPGIKHTPVKINVDTGFRFLSDHSIRKLNQYRANGNELESYSNYLEYIKKVESILDTNSDLGFDDDEKNYVKAVIRLLKDENKERLDKNYQHVGIKRNDWDEFEFAFMPPDKYSLCPFDGISFIQSLNLPARNQNDDLIGMNVSFENGQLKFNNIKLETEGNPKLDSIYLYNIYAKDNVYKYYDSHKVYKLVVDAETAKVYYHVIFIDSIDFDNEQLKDEYVLEGESATAPNISKSDPKNDWFYDFSGWDKSFDNITEDLTVTAVYNKVKACKVKFIDPYDNHLISTNVVRPGTELSHPNYTPNHIEPKDGYFWDFIGWNEKYSITDSVDIYPNYNKVNAYEVKFIDRFNNNILKQVTVRPGTDVEPPNIPNHPEIIDGKYWNFKAWSGTANNVSSNLMIYAEYNTPKACKITFIDGYNGNEIHSTVIPEGESFTLTDLEPLSHPEPKDGYYWDFEDYGTASNVSGDTTVYVNYNKVKAFVIKFMDAEIFDKTIFKTETVREGSNATPPAENPVHSGIINNSYWTFIGWSESYENVSSDLDIYAEYAEAKARKVTFVNSYNNQDVDEKFVPDGTAVTAPTMDSNVKIYNNVEEWYFTGWDKPLDNITSDQRITTVYRKVKYYCFDPEFLNNYTPVSNVELVGKQSFRFISSNSSSIETDYLYDGDGTGSRARFESEMKVVGKNSTFIYSAITDAGSTGYVRPAIGITNEGYIDYGIWEMANKYKSSIGQNDKKYHLLDFSFQSGNLYTKVDGEDVSLDNPESTYKANSSYPDISKDLVYDSYQDSFSLFRGYYFGDKGINDFALPGTSIRCFKHFNRIDNDSTIERLELNLIPAIDKSTEILGFYDVIDKKFHIPHDSRDIGINVDTKNHYNLTYDHEIKTLDELSPTQKRFWKICEENGPSA